MLALVGCTNPERAPEQPVSASVVPSGTASPGPAEPAGSPELTLTPPRVGEVTLPSPTVASATATRPATAVPATATAIAPSSTPTAFATASPTAAAAPALATVMPPSSTPTAVAIAIPTATVAPHPATRGSVPTATAVPPTLTAALPPSPTRLAPTPAPAAGATTGLWQQTGPDFAGATLTNAIVDNGELRLANTGSGHATSGQFVSTVFDAPFAFDNAILSWNATAPAGTSVRLELRVRFGGSWTGWYAMGVWGPGVSSSVRSAGDGNGSVDVDTLKLKSRATALQYRATLATTAASATPRLRLVTVAYADRSKPAAGPSLPRPPARELNVPAYSQFDQDPSIASEICSPTSLTMVLGYWNIPQSVAEVARGVYDRAAGIYGNWPLNTAYAASRGLEAYVARFYSVEQLEQEIAAGQPVEVSIVLGTGEIAGSPPASSPSGHLIVVRGFTAQGDVIVNDPAGSSGTVRRVYQRDQFARVWLREGGVVYLVRPRTG